MAWNHRNIRGDPISKLSVALSDHLHQRQSPVAAFVFSLYRRTRELGQYSTSTTETRQERLSIAATYELAWSEVRETKTQ
jgi:hypothetical protein